MCMCLSLIAITQPNNHLRQKSLCAAAFGRIAPEFLHTLRFRDRQERDMVRIRARFPGVIKNHICYVCRLDEQPRLKLLLP